MQLYPFYKIPKSRYLSAWTNTFRVFCFSMWAWKGIAHLSWQDYASAVGCHFWEKVNYLSLLDSLQVSAASFSSLLQRFLVSTHQANLQGHKPPQVHSYEFIGFSRYFTGKSSLKYTNTDFHVQELMSCTRRESQKRTRFVWGKKKKKQLCCTQIFARNFCLNYFSYEKRVWFFF